MTPLIGQRVSRQLLLLFSSMLHRLIDCTEVNKTRFEDVYGGNIEILHSSEILIMKNE